MYKKSIKEVSNYLIPFIQGIKYYGSNEIEHCLGTMIILNKNGDILTCRHIAEQFILNNQLNDKYFKVISEIKSIKNSENKKKLEKKYNLNNDTIVLSNIFLPFKVNGDFKINIIFHEYLDLAIIRFNDVKFDIGNYPIFSKNIPLQGQSVCKLGYAFPEYSIYEYSDKTNNIVIKKNIVSNFPLFPLDGIVTRHVMDDNKKLSMFETSTPGLRGQSGGPIFDTDGLVYGIQSMTRQIDLNFDVNGTVKRGINKKNVEFTPFINLGIGISSSEIIKFLEDNNIDFDCKLVRIYSL